MAGVFLHDKLGFAPRQNKNYLSQGDFRQVELDNIIQVACGDQHTICLNQDGKVYTWGGHLKRQRGDDPSQRPEREKGSKIWY